MKQPKPISLQTDRNHLTKAQIEARENGEPKGCTAKLVCPSRLDIEGKKEWRRMVNLYKQLDHEVVNDLDIAILTAYCDAVSRFKKAQDIINAEGCYIIGEDGHSVPHPANNELKKLGELILRYSDQLCIAPASRAKAGIVNAKKQEETDPMALFFAKRAQG